VSLVFCLSLTHQTHAIIESFTRFWDPAGFYFDRIHVLPVFVSFRADAGEYSYRYQKSGGRRIYDPKRQKVVAWNIANMWNGPSRLNEQVI